jgi:hypothetical protein
MAEMILQVPDELKAEVESVLGRKLSYAEWQTLCSRFLNVQLKKNLETIKQVDSIIAKSKMTQKQADELADKVNCALSKRYLSESGVKYQEKKTVLKGSSTEKMAICRMKDKSSIIKALESQDMIRELTGEIRKWRTLPRTRQTDKRRRY